MNGKPTKWLRLAAPILAVNSVAGTLELLVDRVCHNLESRHLQIAGEMAVTHHANEAAGAGYSAALGGESVETGLVGGGHSLLRTAIRGRTSLLPGKDAGKTGFLAMAERQSNLKSPRCTHLFERFPCSIEQGKIFAEQGKMLAKLTI